MFRVISVLTLFSGVFIVEEVDGVEDRGQEIQHLMYGTLMEAVLNMFPRYACFVHEAFLWYNILRTTSLKCLVIRCWIKQILLCVCVYMGYVVAHLVEASCYKLEVCGFDSRMGHQNFSFI